MWLQYALDRNDNLVSIQDRPRGRSDIRCPYCKGELTAKKGKIKAHHFAHVTDTCDRVKKNNINLPLFYGFDLILSDRHLNHLKYLESIDFQVDLPFSGKLGKSKKRISSYLEKKDIIIKDWQQTNYQLTDSGKVVLKKLSLAEFCTIQEKLSQDKLIQLQNRINNLEYNIQKTDLFKQSDYYLSRPIKYKKVVDKNQGEYREELEQTLIDLNIYCAQYQRVLNNNLYFLEITTKEEVFYKIGVTTRNIQERVQEISIKLSKLFPKFKIDLLGIWTHRGNAEHYFKYRYEDFNYPINNLTEYFKFPDIEQVKQDLTSLKTKQLSQLEIDILNWK